MLISLNAIRHGPLHDFDVKKGSRNLTGYTIFCRIFILDGKLSIQDRLEILNETEGQDSDCDSVDSPSHIEKLDVIRYAAKC